MPLDKHPEDSNPPNFGRPVSREGDSNLAIAVNALPLNTRIGVQLELARGADLPTAIKNVIGSVGQVLDK